MRINFSALNFSTPFGQNNSNNPNRLSADKISKIAQVQDKYQTKSSYLNEIRNEINLPREDYIYLNKKLEQDRLAKINYIIGEDLDDEDDFIEKMSY